MPLFWADWTRPSISSRMLRSLVETGPTVDKGPTQWTSPLNPYRGCRDSLKMSVLPLSCRCPAVVTDDPAQPGRPFAYGPDGWNVGSMFSKSLFLRLIGFPRRSSGLPLGRGLSKGMILFAAYTASTDVFISSAGPRAIL